MAAYLEEHRKMEKHFQGLELRHIPRGENAEVDEIAKRASHRLAQLAGVFEEGLFKPSASSLSPGPEPPPDLPPPLEQVALDCGPSSGDCLLLELARQEGVDWILDLKTFLVSIKLPEEELEVERIIHQATGYCIKDGDLYQCRPSGIALKFVSTIKAKSCCETSTRASAVTILQQVLSPKKHTTVDSTGPLRSQMPPRWSRGVRRASSMPSKFTSQPKDCKPSRSLGPLLFGGWTSWFHSLERKGATATSTSPSTSSPYGQRGSLCKQY
jgi:hypothetical protein